MPLQLIKKLSFETLVDILSECDEEPKSALDMGTTMVTLHIHPKYGPITLISNAVDVVSAIIIDAQHADAVA